MFSYALYICYICNVNTHTCISMVIHKFGKHCIYHFSHLPLEIHLQIKNITTLPYPQLEVKYPYLATQNIYKSFLSVALEVEILLEVIRKQILT